MTPAKRCDEILRLIDAAIDSDAAIATGSVRQVMPGGKSPTRPRLGPEDD